MKKRHLFVAAVGLFFVLPLWAITVYFTSAPSPVNHGASYYVEAEGYDDYGIDLAVYKNWSWFASNSGYGWITAGAWTGDNGPQTVEYYTEAFDWWMGTQAYDYAYISISGPPNNAPFGARDYSHGSVPQGGNLHASGWAADNEMGAPVTRVDILIDGNDVGDASLGGYRGDVANGYGRQDYTYSGWSFNHNIGSLSAGTHSLTLRAWDNQGASADFGQTTFQVTNSAPSITLTSPAAQEIFVNTALQITSNATDADGNIVYHNLDIQRPDGQWNFQGGWAVGEPYTGGPVGSAGNSTRSASFTFNQTGNWYVRSWVSDGSGNSLHSATVLIQVKPPNNPPTVSWHTQPPSAPYSGTNFTARATGNDVDGNLVAVQVDVQVNGGSWSAFAYNNGGNGSTNTSDGNVITAGAVGTTYRFRARAIDGQLAYSNGGTDIYTSVVTVPKLNQSAPTITSASSFTYGNGYTATASGGSGSGALEWSLGTGSSASGAAIDSSTGAVSASSTGSVAIKVRRLGDSNYSDSPWSADFPITVTQRSITVTLAGSKTYDALFASSGASASITSGTLAPGDSISYSFVDAPSPLPGTYPGLVAATISSSSAPPNRTPSYSITCNGAYSITPRAITVTRGGSKVYDGALAATGASAGVTSGSLAAGDAINYSFGPVSSPVVGGYAIGVTPSITSATAPANRTSGYTIGYAGDYTITQRALALEVLGSKTYDGTTAPTGATVQPTGLVSGDVLTATPGALDSPLAGPRTPSLTWGVSNPTAPSDRTNCYAASVQSSYVVDPRSITVTLSGSKVHDGTSAATGANAAITAGTLAAGDSPSFSFAATSSSDVGSYSGLTTATINNTSAPTARSGSYNITYSGTYAIRPVPSVASGLRAWYRADFGITNDGSDGVSAWADASGNGFDLAQSNAALQPLWVANGFDGQPAIDFVEGEQLVSAAIDLHAGSDDFTVIVVFQPAAAQVDDAALLDHDTGGQQGLSLRQDGATDNRYVARWRNQAQTAWEGASAPAVDSPAAGHLVTFIKEGTTQSVYRLSAFVDSATVSSALHRSTAALALGGSVSVPGEYFTGRIAEVLIYNRALTPAERSQVEAPLAAMYVPDSDIDGLSDAWEQIYFGHLDFSGASDPDGDGLSNSDEVTAQSSPTDYFNGRAFTIGTSLNSSTGTIAYSYDYSGRLDSVNYGSARTMQLVHDAASNLTTITSAGIGGTIADWRLIHGLPVDGSGSGADEAILAADGLPNLAKYAFGLPPATPVGSSHPVVSLMAVGGAQHLVLSYTRPEPAPVDLVYRVEISPDGTNWSAGPGYTVPVTTTTSGGEAVVRIRDATAIGSSQFGRYIRLAIERLVQP